MPDPKTGLPEIDDTPAGWFMPKGIDGFTYEAVGALLDDLRAECRARGHHKLGGRDDPSQGKLIVCTHCHAFWRGA